MSLDAPPGATSVVAALLDDDVFVQEAWRFFAETRGVAILVLGDVPLFVASTKDLPRGTPLFIDVELEKGARGEAVASLLIGAGFTEVYLATGFAAGDLTLPSGLRGVIGKTPPAWLGRR